MNNPFEEILAKLNAIESDLALIKLPPSHQIEIIDRKHLCERLGITEPTAIRYSKKGTIPEIRIGSRVLYNWPAVITALEKQKTKK